MPSVDPPWGEGKWERGVGTHLPHHPFKTLPTTQGTHVELELLRENAWANHQAKARNYFQ